MEPSTEKKRRTAQRLWNKLCHPLSGHQPAYYETEMVRLGAAAVPVLLDVLRTIEFPWAYVPKRIISRIGAKAIPALQEALKEPDYLYRYQVVDTLSWMRIPEAVPLLQEALNDPDVWVRRAAEEALAKFNKPQ